MKKVLLILIVFFLFTEITDAQMIYQSRYSKLSSVSGMSVDDDIAYMKKRRRKKRKSSRGRGSDKQNIIKLNPFGFFLGNLLFYERALNDNISVQLGLGFYSRKTDLLLVEYKYSGFKISPSIRYYFQSEAPKGFYAGAVFNYLGYTEKIIEAGYPDLKNKITGIGGGLVLGYQWIWGSISLDLNGGAGYSSYTYKYDDGYNASIYSGGVSFSGFLPIFGTVVGFAF